MVYSRKRDGRNGGGGGVLISCIAIAITIKPSLASPQCRDGARRVFTDTADIACIKRNAP